MSTPGPRKFLPPNNQFKTPKPAWRKPGPSTQGPRSSSLSSSLKPASTQFSKTPRFATSGGDIDEIDGSFEEKRSSPTERKTQKAARASSGYDDLVDEDDEVDANIGHSKRENDQLARSGIPGTSRKSLRPGDTIRDNEEEDFLQPTSKRLKISSGSIRHHDAIVISSSGSEEDNHYTLDDDHEEKANRHPINAFELDGDFDDDIHSSPTQTRTSKSIISRFRAPATPAADLPNTKPIFKPPPPSQLSVNTTPLPETFSPSRHRGKRDYIPGGLADTVRNWVLELGISISKPSAERPKTVRVAHVRHDLEGRCASIVDGRGAEWLLMSQGQQCDAAVLKVGDCVEINEAGTSCQWSINIDAAGSQEVQARAGREEGASAGRSVNVGVLWKRVLR